MIPEQNTCLHLEKILGGQKVKEFTPKDTSLALTIFYHVKNLYTHQEKRSPQLIVVRKDNTYELSLIHGKWRSN